MMLSISAAIITYKMPNLNSVKIWTHHDEFLLSEELKSVKSLDDRQRITQERKKDAIYLSVYIDGGVSKVFIGDSKIPVAIDGPVHIEDKGTPLDVNAAVHLFGSGSTPPSKTK